MAERRLVEFWKRFQRWLGPGSYRKRGGGWHECWCCGSPFRRAKSRRPWAHGAKVRDKVRSMREAMDDLSEDV